MPMPPAPQPEAPVPLCVDLDGTLIKTDLLWETLVRLLKKNPLYFFCALIWWTRGRAYLKQEMARRITVDATILPYHEKFLAWLREEKKSGRKILLVTASDLKMAQPVAAHVGIFDEIMASDGQTNLRQEAKRRALVERFGERGFDYAGNSNDDLTVWRSAHAAIVVNASPSLAERAGRLTQVAKIFPGDSAPATAIFRSLRPHQWVKNLIIFVPALAGHQLGHRTVQLQGAIAFLAFCLCASAVYVTNDLMDLDADRRHAGKKSRPLASGALPLPIGIMLAPLLLILGLAIAAGESWPFFGVTFLYVVLATSYSWWLKRVILLDVFWLAGLYTTRLIAGGVATNIVDSSWLLVFSMFIFLSLALVKRFVELDAEKTAAGGANGRGYTPRDLGIITALGTASGFLAALVLALYVNSQQVVILYAHPALLLLLCPLLLFWISRVWLLARRGEMHDDPVVFALKDGASYLIGALMLLVIWLATGHAAGN
jgi:4-hydroxybenzoate polyprenyltransferase/phosphoserine phosphatase